MTAQCQNCGNHVSDQYSRVFTPSGHNNPRVCPQCPDKVRNPDGTVREARSSRRTDQEQDLATFDEEQAPNAIMADGGATDAE